MRPHIFSPEPEQGAGRRFGVRRDPARVKEGSAGVQESPREVISCWEVFRMKIT